MDKCCVDIHRNWHGGYHHLSIHLQGRDTTAVAVSGRAKNITVINLVQVGWAAGGGFRPKK